MGCGCGKKAVVAPTPLMGKDTSELLQPTEWGPILWKLLHCMAERVGGTGSTIIDTDQANYFETVLTMLPVIIPCQECQAHAAAYLSANPVPTLRGLYGQTLRSTVREWLFTFHNAVRTNNQQAILVQTIEECSALYQDCMMPKCEYTALVQTVAAAVRLGWVPIEQWRKWYSNIERLRIIAGNMIV